MIILFPFNNILPQFAPYPQTYLSQVLLCRPDYVPVTVNKRGCGKGEPELCYWDSIIARQAENDERNLQPHRSDEIVLQRLLSY